jgi:3,4-dihydroxy 2-butanone 4-phosphate synthase/GTP cyclohydrolase II
MTQARDSFFDPIERSIEAMREGRMCIICDDEDRENEGDLVVAADAATPEVVNFMATHGRGLICCALTEEKARALSLPMMTRHNRAPLQTAFTVSVEAREGVTTGISAADRARTIQVLVDPKSSWDDLVVPGHMFPLVARDGGVLVRSGQTEASVDLARIAGRDPSGVICEIMADDGTMMRVPELRKFADRWNIPMGSVADLIEHRRRTEVLVEQVSKATVHWEGRDLVVTRWRDRVRGASHVAVVSGSVDSKAVTTVRVQAETNSRSWGLVAAARELQGLHASLDRVSQGGGVFLLLSALPAPGEGRPELPPIQLDGEPGRIPSDPQTFGIGAQILFQLGVRSLRLLSNRPRRIAGLHGYGLALEGFEPYAPHLHGPDADFLERFLALVG